jgi:hypothetical protein
MNESASKVRWNVWRELTILAVIVMEVSWGALWLQIFSPPLRGISAFIIFLVFFGTVLLTHVFARILNHLNLIKNVHRILVIGIVILSGWANIRLLMSGLGEMRFTDFLTRPIEEVSAEGRLVTPELWILAATFLLTWRGFSLARSWGGRDTVMKSLLWGIGFYAAYGVFSTITHQQGALWLMYVFISASLIAMVTSRVSTLVRMRGGTVSPFDVRWVGSILSATIVITGLAALVSGILSQQVERINQVFRIVVYGIITFLILPIAYLLKLGEPAIEAVRGMMTTPTPAPQLPAGESGLDTIIGPEILNELPDGDGGGSSLQIILIGLVFLVLLILMLRIANSWQTRQEGGEQDERQSLLEGASLWEALINALRNRIFQTANDINAAARLRQKDRLRAAARIRRVYGELMNLCGDLGQPRPEPVTPLEFLPAARQVFPNLNSDLEIITRSYLRIRYGELPETHQEVEMVETAWKRVSEEGSQIKKQAQVKK